MSELDPRASVANAYERIAADGRAGIWIELVAREQALVAAETVWRRQQDGETLPLAGLTMAAKGNMDVVGLRTTAGCPSYGAIATRSGAAVRRLEAAGAVVVGVTNLDQFATGLVGTRSPYGACPNSAWPDLVAGGSSAGSAVAVATGMVDIALGTDTAGSGRIPAAANGIVGFKPTRGWISAAGVVPACQSIDCVSVFARTVKEAYAAVLAGAGPDPDDPWSRSPAPASAAEGPDGRPVRIGIPSLAGLVLDKPFTPVDFLRGARAIAEAVGGELVGIDLDPFLAAGDLLYEGAFVAERYAAVGSFIESHPDGLDPVVAGIITRAGTIPAWKLAADRTELERLRLLTQPAWHDVDIVVVPTASRIPSPAEVIADPLGPNRELGRYTNFVNLLDLCALSLPVGPATPEHPPLSLSLVAPAWHDPLLADLGARLA
jgi:allophanate hydrolase